MDSFLSTLGTNQLLVAVLAIAVWGLSRVPWVARRPASVHCLWMLVFLKCVTPPLVTVPVLPGSAEEGAFALLNRADANALEASAESTSQYFDRSAPVVAVVANDVEHHGPQADAKLVPRRRALRAERSLEFGPVVVSLSVTVVLVLLAGLRLWRLERILPHTGAAGDRERSLADRAKWIVGARSVPRLVVVDTAVSPMLLIGLRGSAIVLPKPLVGRASDERLLHILVHEMAHFVRRDHVTLFLSTFVTSLFWWNPALWLARRNLRLSAETCCDALTLERLSGSRRRYAETLVAVVDFVRSETTDGVSAATSFGESRFLKRRIEMIASTKVKTGLSGLSVVGLLCAAATLPFLPARADSADDGTKGKDVAVDQQSAPTGTNGQQAPAQPVVPGEAGVPGMDDLTAVALAEEEFTTSPFRPVRKNPKFRLPDYLPAGHGNVVEVQPKQFFMLTPYGSTHKWHVYCAATRLDMILTIPPLKDLRQGQTFPIQKNDKTTTVAFVESEYANDRDIGVRVTDNATGKVLHQRTLLMNASRYQWVGDWIEER